MVKDPFAVYPSPDNYFESTSHGRVERLLLESVKEGEPYILVTGEYGVGKTLLCLKLSRFLEMQPDILAVPVSTPAAPYVLLLRSIAARLEVTEFTDAGATEGQVETILFDLFNSGKIRHSVHIVIDDLHDIDQQMLLRCVYLANFHVNDFYPFRLICFSHPRFIRELEKNSKFVPFLQRFRRRLNIEPLQRDELKEYIYFRLLKAGAKGRPIFDNEALRCIADISGRIPRLINNLCDRLLLKAVELSIDRIDSELVREVCRKEEMDGMSHKEGNGREGAKRKGIRHIKIDAIAAGKGNDQGLQEEMPLNNGRITRRHLKTGGLLLGAAVVLAGIIFLFIPNSYHPAALKDGKIDLQSSSGTPGNGNGVFTATGTANGNDESGKRQEHARDEVQAFSAREDIPDQRIKIHQLTTDDSYDPETESTVLPGETPYTLIVYSSPRLADMKNELKRLRDQGLTPLYVAEAVSDSGETGWNICLGSFVSGEDARKSIWFARFPRAEVRFLPYTLLLSLAERAEDTDGLRKTLEVDGYHPWLEPWDNGQYRLLLGAYPTRKEADLRIRELQKEGVTAIVVKK